MLGTGGVLTAAYEQIEELIRERHREAAAAVQRARETKIQQLKNSQSFALGSAGGNGATGAKPENETVATVIHRTFATVADYGANPDETGGSDDLERRVLDAYQQTRRASNRLSLTLVGGFAGSGKSEFARFLSAVTGWTILDKDTLTRALVEQLLLAHGGDINDRHTPLYQEKVRPYEYRCLLDAAMENLKAGVSTVLTAPFLKEFADEAWLRRVQNRCAALQAAFTVVWVKCDVESMYDYISFRGAARDTWKLNNWDEYLATIDPDFEPQFPHYTVDNRLNAAVALADQAREIAMRMQS